MLAGHFGIAQFGKGARREIPIALLVIAAYLPDLARIPLSVTIDRYEIWSHSIVIVAAMALGLGMIWLLRGGSWGAAVVLAGVCLLHWPADVFTGCKPTTFGGPWLGIVSYRRPINDLLVEGALIVGGWLFARRRGFPIGKKWLALAFGAQLAFLVSMYSGAQFIIGQREWMWHPAQSLVPQPHVLEATPCFGAEHPS
jgi:hypothetical protein